jgi:transcriptional regulator with XRE-family HTH domain
MSSTDPGARNRRLGARIRKRRHVLDWEQEELAAKVGVHVNSVQKWESGAHYPARHLGRLEQVLGITLEDDPEPAPDPVSPRLRQVAVEELGEDQGEFVISAIRAALRGEDVPRRNHRRAAAS